jgi:chorismate mutase
MEDDWQGKDTKSNSTISNPFAGSVMLPNDAEVKLAKLRTRIDELDDEISRLLASRHEIVLEIAEVKRALSIPLKVNDREFEILTRVSSHGKNESGARFIRSVYEQILAGSRDAQTESL